MTIRENDFHNQQKEVTCYFNKSNSQGLHNWITEGQSRKTKRSNISARRRFSVTQSECISSMTRFGYSCTLTHTYMHTVCTHMLWTCTGCDRNSMKLKQLVFSGRNKNISQSQSVVYLLPDRLCRSPLIYIPDRPHVSPICFKIYICVKWMTL